MDDKQIDTIISYLQHPLEVMIIGLVCWFALKWSIMRAMKSVPEEGFFSDQKDEMLVCLVFGLLTLVLDDEALVAYYTYVEPVIYGEVEKIPENLTLSLHHYALIAPIVERMLWMGTIAQKVKNKFRKIKITVDADEENSGNS